MAGVALNQQLNLIDSAIGPLTITTTVYQGFDVDDFTHNQAIGQCITLKMIYLASIADPTLAANRTPVSIEGTTVGGF